MKKKVGRPKLDVKNVTVSMLPQHREKAKRIGKGSPSIGVRMALDKFKEQES